MLFTTIFKLPVIVLALVVGIASAALPGNSKDPLVAVYGPSHYFFLFLRVQPFDS